MKESYEKLITIQEDMRRYSNELAEVSEYHDSVCISGVQEELEKTLSLLEGIIFFEHSRRHICFSSYFLPYQFTARDFTFA